MVLFDIIKVLINYNNERENMNKWRTEKASASSETASYNDVENFYDNLFRLLICFLENLFLHIIVISSSLFISNASYK